MQVLNKERLSTDFLHITMSSNEDRDRLFKMLSEIDLEYPVDVQIKKAKKDRTLQQNRMMWQWWRDAEEQGDMKAWEYRAYCKLHFGVRILQRDSLEYREKYQRIIRPMAYEQKLELMVEPFDFPVTSAMTVKQHSEFLDKTAQHLRELGIHLTAME
jgi:hypothetical protein